MDALMAEAAALSGMGVGLAAASAINASIPSSAFAGPV
jgi:hypothetical protein